MLSEHILLNPGIVYDKNDFNHPRLSCSFASLEQLEEGLIRLSQLIKILS